MIDPGCCQEFFLAEDDVTESRVAALSPLGHSMTRSRSDSHHWTDFRIARARECPPKRFEKIRTVRSRSARTARTTGTEMERTIRTPRCRYGVWRRFVSRTVVNNTMCKRGYAVAAGRGSSSTRSSSVVE